MSTLNICIGLRNKKNNFQIFTLIFLQSKTLVRAFDIYCMQCVILSDSSGSGIESLLDLKSRGYSRIEPHSEHCVGSLTKTLYPLRIVLWGRLDLAKFRVLGVRQNSNLNK